MSPLVTWTPQAQEDLIDIYLTIGLDNEAAAGRTSDGIDKQALLLRHYSRLGVRSENRRHRPYAGIRSVSVTCNINHLS